MAMSRGAATPIRTWLPLISRTVTMMSVPMITDCLGRRLNMRMIDDPCLVIFPVRLRHTRQSREVKIIKLAASKIKAASSWLIYMCSVNRSAHLRALRSAAAQATANVIKSARERAGLKQRDLATRLEWAHSVIAMIEINQRQVKIPEFIAIAEQTGVEPVSLFKTLMRELRKLERLSAATIR
jgi:DNA-binding XRE family transcriptional regulator